MGVKRIKVKSYKDASYLMFAGGGGGGSGGTHGSSGSIIGIDGHGGSGVSIQLAMQREKDRKKQEVKNQLEEYKQQLKLKEEIRRQEAKIDAEIKQDQWQRNMIDPKVWDTHTRDVSSPKLRNIFKDIDAKHRLTLCDMIETNPKEDNFVMKIIKNIGKKKPPKNMTIVQ